MSFYTLENPKNYTLFRLFSKRKTDPKKGLRKAILASRAEGAYLPQLRFPTPEQKKVMGDKWASEAPKRTRSEIFVAGMNAMKRHLEEINTEDAFIESEVEDKLYCPMDLTLRQIAFIAKAVNRDTMRLVGEISGGLAPEVVGNWKTRYEIEKQRHEETKYRQGQVHAEIKAAKRDIARLRDTLHANQIEDPTLHPSDGGRAGEAGTVDAEDVRPSDIEGTHARDSGEDSVGDGLDDGSDYC